MTPCPCGHPQPYEQCCGPIHADHARAHTPEQLMRSRYSAHVKCLADYVVETYHPSCHAEQQRDAIEQSIDSRWCKLEVVSTEPGRDDYEGYVTFKAFFEQDGIQHCLEERSRFVQVKGLWYYIDGTFPKTHEASRPTPTLSHPKLGRNDPCACGSGKKWKKCCG
ncbi:YchJ family metal-binding protein [Vibrio ostreicida]|uniref:YchJ family metal-binding protein n=1 Tax=Vibrio ostreicida TaxID=526588 RepID=UPI003B5B47F1